MARQYHRHGMRHTVEYTAYARAKQRCIDAGHPRYEDYGGRGIEFRFVSFEQFFTEVGHRPSKLHSIDRIENDGHYEVGNVKWSTRSEQMVNRRKRTHCLKGHALSPDNVRSNGINVSNVMCKLCHNRRSLSYYHAKKKEKIDGQL